MQDVCYSRLCCSTLHLAIPCTFPAVLGLLWGGRGMYHISTWQIYSAKLGIGAALCQNLLIVC